MISTTAMPKRRRRERFRNMTAALENLAKNRLIVSQVAMLPASQNRKPTDRRPWACLLRDPSSDHLKGLAGPPVDGGARSGSSGPLPRSTGGGDVTPVPNALPPVGRPPGAVGNVLVGGFSGGMLSEGLLLPGGELAWKPAGFRPEGDGLVGQPPGVVLLGVKPPGVALFGVKPPGVVFGPVAAPGNVTDLGGGEKGRFSSLWQPHSSTPPRQNAPIPSQGLVPIPLPPSSMSVPATVRRLADGTGESFRQ